MSTDGINPLVTLLGNGDERFVVKDSDQTSARAEDPAVPTAERAGVEKQDQTQLATQQVEDITKVLNENARLFNISLQFRVDEDINRIVVSVFDKETEEVIRQVPPEALLQLSKSLDQMVGLLFNETA
ncbi:MAG TPA: flagellar protein FlaG [Acidobacteriota bacterium]|nr:flagellar protein FlaG [Acidobacteriota bacterium]